MSHVSYILLIHTAIIYVLELHRRLTYLQVYIYIYYIYTPLSFCLIQLHYYYYYNESLSNHVAALGRSRTMILIFGCVVFISTCLVINCYTVVRFRV